MEVNVNKPCAFGELVVNDEAIYIWKLRRVSFDWVLFENIQRGSFNAQVRFPSRYIFLEAIERFLVLAMPKSLCFHCLRHYEGQLVFENEFIFHELGPQESLASNKRKQRDKRKLNF